jgi:hypothetical protein
MKIRGLINLGKTFVSEIVVRNFLVLLLLGGILYILPTRNALADLVSTNVPAAGCYQSAVNATVSCSGMGNCASSDAQPSVGLTSTSNRTCPGVNINNEVRLYGAVGDPASSAKLIHSLQMELESLT